MQKSNSEQNTFIVIFMYSLLNFPFNLYTVYWYKCFSWNLFFMTYKINKTYSSLNELEVSVTN